MSLQIVAVLILLVFYGCYFAKMFSQRRKGIQTDQMGKGKSGNTRTIEQILKAASLSVPLVEAINIFLGNSMMPDWLRYTGIAIAIFGDAVFVISILTMKDSWRAGVSETDRTELITDGIYQISRNPAFLGFDLVYIGVLLMFFNWWLLGFSVFAILTFHIQIVKVEEPFLVSIFGQTYTEYKRKVNRYLGRKSS